MTTRSIDPDKRYYVYLLHRAPGEISDISEVFYVGKGVASRVLHHFHAAPAADAAATEKHEVIRKLQEAGGHPEEHATIVAADLSEAEAYKLESVLISFINEVSPTRLTNLVAGHSSNEVMMPLVNARRFLGAERARVDWFSADQLAEAVSSNRRVVMAVTISGETFAPEPVLRESGEPGPRPNTVRLDPTGEEVQRRGWDPRAPWTDEEALLRADRWWQVGPESMRSLQALARESRLVLAALVADIHDGSGAVKYVWEVEDRDWGSDAAGRQFLVPAGKALQEHVLMGLKPVKSNGRSIMEGFQGGGPSYFFEPSSSKE